MEDLYETNLSQSAVPAPDAQPAGGAGGSRPGLGGHGGRPHRHGHPAEPGDPAVHERFLEQRQRLDYRTENLITYTPNSSVTPIVTYGGALTDRSSVSNTAKALEEQGWRVVAGINGDFYNVNNGLPIGIVATQGQLRSSDGGYHAIGFRADGTAILGKPSVSMTASYGAAGEPLYAEA